MSENSPQKDIPQGGQNNSTKFDSERINDLRERLYARGDAPKETLRHPLSPSAIPLTPTPVIQREPEPEPKLVEKIESAPLAQQPEMMSAEGAVSYSMTSPRRNTMRKKLVIAGIVFFVIATLVSSLILYSGNNTISGENISISASGPVSVGGGEEFAFQVSVANQNTVPIQSATLIIEYPKGSRNSNDGKEILVERKQLDEVNAGELLNIPLAVRVFGEENEEKEIKISIDYRVAGSNATFHKVSDPLKFKVSTSPIVMTFDTLKTITSGQEIELSLNVQSNSPSPLSDILVKVVYPAGFDFSEASPETSSGEDMWKIGKLKPGEKKNITIKGLMTGYENEVRKFSASAGVAHITDKNTLASILAQTDEQIVIEQAFLNVGVTVNGSSEESIIVDSNGLAIVVVKFENTLDTTIYDGTISIALGGNALDEFEVAVTDGFYDSTKNTIMWDGSSNEILKEILPGRTSSVTFTLDPRNDVGSTPEINFKVAVSGERVYETGVPEKLAGTAERTIKVESVPTLGASALHSAGPFVNTGPTPPIAEEVTQYTFVFTAHAGTNDVTGAEVTTVLPQYVSWLDLVTDGDSVTYNPTSRAIKWVIGDMEANSTEEVSMQVSFLPSLTQVGMTPTILEAQRFKATDRFTGTIVRAEHPALTTSLSDESNEALHNGQVRASSE